MSPTVHVVMPAGVRDPERPSGGNVYDVRVCVGLAARGWSVLEHEIAGDWPRPDVAARMRLAHALRSIEDGGVVLVDGLVGSTAPETFVSQANRLRLAMLVHMPLGLAFASLPSVGSAEAQALDAADVVIVTSAWTRDWLLEAYRLDPVRLRVAVPGADPASVAPGSEAGNRLLAVGPISRGKGHDTLVAALSWLQDLDWELECVGSVTVDPETAGDVERWAAAAGGRVHVTGPLLAGALEAAYGSADLLVHPSRSETYGMVLTEALARGLPVLATRVGGTREALGMTQGGPPGLLVTPGDPAALAAALRRWLTDEEIRRGLRRAARARRAELPTWNGTVDAVHEALASTVLAGAAG
jgi:glycosyltransferase involved in cell wall biosynthesis